MFVLRRSRTALVALLATAALVAPGTLPAEATDTTEQALHRLINRARANHGIRRLRLSERLSNTARAHSQDMAAGRRMYHSGCLSCELRSYEWRIAGENVGTGETARQVHRKMLRSRSHRANILRRGYRRVGVGVARQGGVLYVTEIFLG